MTKLPKFKSLVFYTLIAIAMLAYGSVVKSLGFAVAGGVYGWLVMLLLGAKLERYRTWLERDLPGQPHKFLLWEDDRD